MPTFSTRSIGRLLTCGTGLLVLFKRVIQKRDCTIIGGVRTHEEQAALFNADPPKTKTLNSKHLPDANGKSRAVDVMPYQPDKPEMGGIDWRTDKALWENLGFYALSKEAVRNAKTEEDRRVAQDILDVDEDDVKEILENIKRLHNFTGYVQGVADTLGVPVRNGADWDSDSEHDDQTFVDAPHWELTNGGHM